MHTLPVVGVMGSGQEPHPAWSLPLGQHLAGLGVHLLTGGGAGVMAAVTEAFVTAPRPRGGLALGVLPSDGPPNPEEPPPGYPNPFVELCIRTHLDRRGDEGSHPMSRNHVNILTSDVVIALPGGVGTASEIDLALEYRRPIVAFGPDRRAWPNLPETVSCTSSLALVTTFVAERLGLTERRS